MPVLSADFSRFTPKPPFLASAEHEEKLMQNIKWLFELQLDETSCMLISMMATFTRYNNQFLYNLDAKNLKLVILQYFSLKMSEESKQILDPIKSYYEQLLWQYLKKTFGDATCLAVMPKYIEAIDKMQELSEIMKSQLKF